MRPYAERHRRWQSILPAALDEPMCREMNGEIEWRVSGQQVPYESALAEMEARGGAGRAGG